MDSVDQRSDCTFCAVWSWSTLSTKTSCVVISKERLKFLPSVEFLHVEGPFYLSPFPTTTNFRLFQTQSICRHFKLDENGKIWVLQTDRKHWEKGKLLIMSNFYFSHSIFNRLELQTHKNQGLFGKGLISGQLSDKMDFMDPSCKFRHAQFNPLLHKDSFWCINNRNCS